MANETHDDTGRGGEWAPRPIVDPRVGALAEGRYRVLRRLGEGGMGVVYEAEHVRVRRRVALKVLRLPFAAQPAAVARFQREAFAATAIGDRHIVEVLDMGHFEDGTPFLVMERLDGEDLETLIAREAPLSLVRASALLAPLCRALCRAHGAGIVHRDLKPSNVMVCRDGHDELVKVLDFGIAKMRFDENITEAGQRLGTPAYMAPEQRSDPGCVDARADLYSLGVLLHVMLTRRLPRADADVPLHVHAARTLRALRPELPDAVSILVEHLLAPEPGARPESAAQVLAELEGWRGDGRGYGPVPEAALALRTASTFDLPPSQAARPATSASARRPRRLRLALVTTLAVLLAALATLWTRGPERVVQPRASRTLATAPRPVVQTAPRAEQPTTAPEPAAVPAAVAPPAPMRARRRPRVDTHEPSPQAPEPSPPSPVQPAAPPPTPAPEPDNPLRRELLPIEL